MSAARFTIPPHWPAPADTAAAARLAANFAELGPAEADLAARPEMARLLACLGGHSPYLAELALREAASIARFATDGPDAALADAMAALAAIAHDSPRARLSAGLRHAKRQVALVTALADIGGIWQLPRITAALTQLAEAALRKVVAHLLASAHRAGELRLPHPGDPERDCGFTVLGMGKLGGRELNYSSDIDLVLLWDPDRHPYHADGPGACFTRIARNLVTLMEARDAEGYVFRTDLRLRPDPAATPPAISLPAALSYYESMGQTWERAAMIKARPVAGDDALGHQFLEAIRPFVWRRHLDFAALADIRAMKRRIDAHKGGPGSPGSGGTGPARLLGHNVKLGRGGIREIEFTAQALQMAWGGRDPALRVPTTLGALDALAEAGRLPRAAVTALQAAYHELRRIEHRLQMVADRQTHALPARRDELDRFARFLDLPDATALAALLIPILDLVAEHFSRLFAGEADAAAELPLDFGPEPDRAAATLELLAALGFANARGLVEAVRGWLAGHPRALRSPRAQEIMRALLPMLLRAIARQPQPDTVFTRFDRLLTRLPAGVQLLSLFQHNPALLDRVATVLAAAPPLAEHLASNPAALEGLLGAAEIDQLPLPHLRRQLADARALEDVMSITRRFVRGEEFRLSLATMEGRANPDSVGLARTALADAALTCLLPAVQDDVIRRHGSIAGGGMAVVALGKAGGREMMAGSDLDLMLIYDHPADAAESAGGRRNLPPAQYFARLAHGLIGAISAQGPEGPLYAVDMRLRPSGNKGPVAVSLAAFIRYHAGEAWTWERMALTRARVVTGPPALCARIEAAMQAALAAAGPAARIREDARQMRARMLRDQPLGGPWDVKHRPGGLIEVEFITQVLQLTAAASHPELLSPTTRLALARLAQAGLLASADAALLIRADHLWRSVQGMRRIAVAHPAEDALPRPALATLLRDIGLLDEADAGGPESGGVDVARLHATMNATAQSVRDCFVRLIGKPE